MESTIAAVTPARRASGAHLAVISISLAAIMSLACHHRRTAPDPGGDPAIALMFRDTASTTGPFGEGRSYNVKIAAERQALQAAVARQRALWDAAKPRDYRFLTRSECFCPGPIRWLLVEVRHDQPVRAWDATGRRVEAVAQQLDIDRLFDSIARVSDPLSRVQVAFDEQWHFPRFLHTSMVYPDAWSNVLIRGFHPL
jgi:hypothetical protein